MNIVDFKQYAEDPNYWYCEDNELDIEFGIPSINKKPDQASFDFALELFPQITQLAKRAVKSMAVYITSAREEYPLNEFLVHFVLIVVPNKHIEIGGVFNDPYLQWIFELRYEKMTNSWNLWSFKCEQQ